MEKEEAREKAREKAREVKDFVSKAEMKEIVDRAEKALSVIIVAFFAILMAATLLICVLSFGIVALVDTFVKDLGFDYWLILVLGVVLEIIWLAVMLGSRIRVRWVRVRTLAATGAQFLILTAEVSCLPTSVIRLKVQPTSP